MALNRKDTFGEWMDKVDGIVSATIGLSVHDLPDWGFRDAYDDDMTPTDAAEEVLAEAGWEG